MSGRRSFILNVRLTQIRSTTISDRIRWRLVWLVLIVQTILLAGLIATERPAQPPVGGGYIPAPDPMAIARDLSRIPSLAPDFVGARITASANQVSTDGPLTFDTTRWDSGMWDPAYPTRLTFHEDGICEVRAQLTILGTLYNGAPAEDIVLTVRRDGDPNAFVAFARLTGQDPSVATGINAGTTDWFEAGEYVEVFVTPGLTVEANWPGRSNVSPVLTVAC